MKNNKNLWVYIGTFNGIKTYKCGNCGYFPGYGITYKYCPECGKKKKVVQK